MGPINEQDAVMGSRYGVTLRGADGWLVFPVPGHEYQDMRLVLEKIGNQEWLEQYEEAIKHLELD